MNSNIPVPQFVGRQEIRRCLEQTGAPQFALAYLAKVSDAQLSLVLAGRKKFSWEAQNNVSEVLTFLREKVELAAPLPVDFSNMEVIEPLYKEWKKSHLESEVVGTTSK